MSFLGPSHPLRNKIMRVRRLLLLGVLCVTFRPAAAQTYCMPDGMRAYLSFEQTRSSREGSAAPLNPLDTRPGFATDARVGNYAVVFNGEDDHLRYGFLNASFANMSVMFWMRPNTTDGIQTLFDEGGSTNAVGIRINDGTLEAAAREDEVQVDFTHQTPVQPGVWQHVALVYEAGVVTLYLDGVADTDPDGDTGFATLAAHTNNGGFGATLESDAFGEGSTTANSATHFFSGLLDEVAYYRGSDPLNALTQEQIDATIACDPNIPFECNADAYVSQGNGTSLRRVDVTTSPFTFITVDEPISFEYNAAGYNPQDDFAYAFNRSRSDKTIVRVAGDGTITDLGPLPAIAGSTSQIYTGDVSPDGIFYLAHVDRTADSLSAIDLTSVPYTVEKRALSLNVDVADVSFNPVDGQLYGIATGQGDLITIDPATGTVTRTPVTLQNGNSLPSGDYGASWFNGIGQLYAYNNIGRIYRIDLGGDMPTATLVSTGPSAARNDGFACATAPVSADVGLDKEAVDVPEGPVQVGDAFVYTIDLTNNGPSIATNVTVEDVLADGLAFVAVSVDSLSTGGALDPDRFVLDAPDPGTNGAVTLTLFDLTLGAPNGVRLTLEAEALADFPVAPPNTVTITSADQDDPNDANDEDTVGGGSVDAETQAEAFALRFDAPYPNPLHGEATLRYALPQPSAVKMEVFDLLGRRVAVLVDGEQRAGTHEVLLDAARLPVGTYVCVLRVGDDTVARRLTRIR